MRSISFIFYFFILIRVSPAQTGFTTVVTPQPVVAGEAFQVQYIIEDGDMNTPVKPPVFANFRFVTGPNVYSGKMSSPGGIKPVQNVVYTLEAGRPGRFLVPGASIVINGRTIRSNDAWVEVISKAEALKRFENENESTASEYFLRPGEDPYDKIRKNLFVKMMVDKRSCFVGEPVLATFKLYSRLESKSDIVKNPGFYGFTVYDMVNLSDKEMSTETVNGKLFDVHTIRKVQLYPLQAGQYTVDPMMISNRVEFSKSAVNKKTEQVIMEGVNRRHVRPSDMGDEEEDKPREGTLVYESEMSTAPVTITVKPIPDKNKPETYNGAVGRFAVSADVAGKTLKKNEEGFLEIRVSGKGNFIQLAAPTVQWPAGIEGFEPTVRDDLDKTKLPLSGTRVFRYPFVCAAAGSWTVPAVSFSFFDTDSNRYKTVSTQPVTISSSKEEKEKSAEVEKKVSLNDSSAKASRVALIVVVSLVLIIVAYWIFKKKEPQQELTVQAAPALLSATELLAPAYAALAEEEDTFYKALHKSIWHFASLRFAVSGSGMNKLGLTTKMENAGVSAGTAHQVFNLLRECEAGMFTSALLDHNKQDLMSLAQTLLDAVDADLAK